ncbi:MAG TPA: iron ABC transporter permease [Devosiaceae bacterium]|nr:iron ABC transporter permease [Devosiaceae bacterium]
MPVSGEVLLLAALALYVALIAVLPLGRLLIEALRPGAEGAVLGILTETWGGRSVGRALGNTLVASLFATMLSVVLGTALALLLRMTDLPGRGLLISLALLPMLIPPQISALAWIELSGPSSPILGPLGLAPPPGQTNPLYSMAGIVWVMGLEHAPLVLLTVAAGLSTMPRDLAEAGRIAGARPLRVVLSIVMPAIAPAILAGGTLAFASAIGNFGVPALLGIPGRVTLLTTLIYQRLNGFGPSILGEVSAIALLLMGLAVAGLILRGWLMRRGGAQLDRTAASVEPFALGSWRLPAAHLVWLLLLIVSVLPLLALMASALVPAVGMRLGWETVSFTNFERLLTGSPAVGRAFLNSFALAGTAALVSVLISLPLSYLAVTRRWRVARLLDALIEAPYAVPGTVLALGVIIVFLPPLPALGISLYGSFAILLVAYLARFLLLAHRPVSAAMAALDPALDEAARIVGARPMARLVQVAAPAVFTSALAGGLLIFMTAFNELTVSALLWSTGQETLGVLVFQLQYEGNSPAAAALATLIVAITLALAGLIAFIGKRLAPGTVPWQM